MSDFMESLFQGVDILIDKKLENVSYDSTIICTILDASNSKNGQYRVTDGSVTYIAYSDQSNYKNGDQVRVSVPMGDFSQKKFIVGRYVSDNDASPITYISPLDQNLNITGNLTENLKASILANGKDLEKVIWNKYLDDDKSFAAMQDNNLYNTVILKADFKTLLENYGPVLGNYGLRLCFQVKPSVDSNARFRRWVELDSAEMFGNPYSFAVASPQSKIVKIDTMGIIVAMELVLYQKNNFKNKMGNRIEYPDAKSIPDNIIISNIVLGLGCDLTLLEDNKVQIYTTNKLTYKYSNYSEDTNQKDLGLLWLNKDENNQYIGFSDGIYDPSYDEISYIKQSKLDNRLLEHKGQEGIPQDETSLKLAANISEAAAAIKKAISVVNKDLVSLLREFKSYTRNVQSFQDNIQELLNPPTDEDGNTNLRSLNGVTAHIEKCLEDLQNQYAQVLQYGYKKWKDEEITNTDWNKIWTSTINECHKEIDASFEKIVLDMSWLLGTDNDKGFEELVTHTGYKSIHDTYSYRLNKLIFTMLGYLGKLEENNKYYNDLNKYFPAAFFNNYIDDKNNKVYTELEILKSYEARPKEAYTIYKELDLSACDNKYCIYWYRYEKDYIPPFEEEQLMPNGWRRLVFEDKMNVGLPPQYLDQDGKPIVNENGQLLHAPKNNLEEGFLTVNLQNDLEEEHYIAVLFYNHNMYKSNELIFTNEDVIPDKTTLDKGDILTFEHLSNSTDNYQSYSITNYLMDSSDQYKIRQIRCHYDGLLAKDNAFVSGQIYWYVPVHSTMLVVDQDDLKDRGFVLDETKSGYIFENKEQIKKKDFLLNTYYYLNDNQDYELAKAWEEIGPSDADDETLSTKDCYMRVISELCFYKKIEAAKLENDSKYEWEKWDFTNGEADGVDNRDFWYLIKPWYEKTASNNSIRCEFVKTAEDDSVRGEQIFKFGIAGTSGTRYTLSVVSDNLQPSTTPSKSLPLTITLRDLDNNILSLPQNVSIEWQCCGWGSSDDSEQIPLNRWIVNQNETKTEAYVEAPKDWFGIIEASTQVNLRGTHIDQGIGETNIQENADGSIVRTIELTTLYDIPFASGDFFIQGPTQIIYNSLGTLDNTSVFGVPYKLFKRLNDIDDEGKIIYSRGVEIPDIKWVVNYYKKGPNNLLVLLNEDDDDYAFYRQYMPKIENNILYPAPMYLNNLDCYAVVMAVDAEENVGTIYWRQPLIIMQNRYSSSMLNEWDGEFKINETDGTIMGTMFGAGQKSTNNTFEGVLMGNVAKGAGLNSNIGIYGFNDGIQSFGLNIDGTAFFGKAGNGRIQIDGNSGRISSASYEYTKTGAANAGMLIDLDDGFIEIRSGKGRLNGTGNNQYAIDGSGYIKISVMNPYLQIKDYNNNSLMYIGMNTYYLQSSNYKTGTYPTGDSSIVAEANKGLGMKINLQDGQIEAYNLKVRSKNIYLDSTPNATTHLIVKSNTGKNLLYVGGTSYYLQSNDYSTTNDTGIKINLTTGKIGAYSFTLDAWNKKDGDASESGIYFNSAPGSGGNYLLVGNSTNKISFSGGGTLSITAQNFTLSTNNIYIGHSGKTFNILGKNRSSIVLRMGSNFGVTSGGKLYASGAEISGALNGGSININDKFIVTSAGYVTATSGKIGGWTIDSDEIKRGNTVLGTDGEISGALVSGGHINGGSISIGGNATDGFNFVVTDEGYVTAQHITAGGGRIEGSMVIGSNGNFMFTGAYGTLIIGNVWKNGEQSVFGVGDKIGITPATSIDLRSESLEVIRLTFKCGLLVGYQNLGLID